MFIAWTICQEFFEEDFRRISERKADMERQGADCCDLVFGPIHSRRLGVSLGINLSPDDGKVCSFDCVYCEAGYNAQGTGSTGLPTRLISCRAICTLRSSMENFLLFLNGETTLVSSRFPCWSRTASLQPWV